MDFQKLPYNINKIAECKNDKELFALYPEFDHPIFKLPLPVNKYKSLCIIIMLYSKNQSLLLEYKESRSAKLRAVEEVGWTVLNKKISNIELEKMVFGGVPAFTQMCVEYIRRQKSIEFSKLCIYIDSYYNQLQKLAIGDTDDEKTKDLLANIDRIETTINKVLLEYANNDSNKTLREKILDDVESDRLELRPEDIANKIRNGDELDLGVFPYGKEYKYQKYGNRKRINPYDEY